eukprot:934308_1
MFNSFRQRLSNFNVWSRIIVVAPAPFYTNSNQHQQIQPPTLVPQPHVPVINNNYNGHHVSSFNTTQQQIQQMQLQARLQLLGGIQNPWINQFLSLPYNQPLVIPNTTNEPNTQPLVIPNAPLNNADQAKKLVQLLNQKNDENDQKLVDEYLRKNKSRSKIKRNKWILG